MTNHDIALVIGLWALAAIAWGAVILHDKWKTAGRVIDEPPAPQPEPDVPAEPRYRPLTRAELTALFRDHTTPHVIRVMAAAELHRNGWCNCGPHPFDQDAQLTDTDLDWLDSQRGEAS